jgi:hypothetical protein
MKKTLWIASVALIVGVAAAAVFERSGRPAPANGEVSERVAQQLQQKIDAVKKAKNTAAEHRLQTVEVTEAELESYVLYRLRDDIPARIDSINVQLTPGAIAADTQLTFSPNSTGNTLVDTLLSGTHNLFIKGKLSGANHEGRFELDQVKVDGIPVPKLLIETLIKKYVKPKYPEVDLTEPFELPWNIDRITIEEGKAVIAY